MTENTYLDQLIGAARITDLTTNHNGGVVASFFISPTKVTGFSNRLTQRFGTRPYWLF